jgi:transposase
MGTADCPAYDSEEKTWRHLNFFQHEVHLHARVPRVTCKSCGIKQVSVPWARPNSGFTLLFEALVMAMVQAMPVAVVARMIDEWDTRLRRIIHHYVERARDRADHSDVTSVAFDETASRRGHNYVSLFVDLVRRRVLFVVEGKSLPRRRPGMPAPSRPSPRTWRPMAEIARPLPRCAST